jgi:drug/metabolite transporter (DMT)-like permease
MTSDGPIRKQEERAALAMVASALGFSLMAVCVKRVSGRIPVAEVMLARAGVSVLLSWWMVRRAGVNPWGNRRGLLVWRGVIGSVALFCVYAALARLPLAEATLLQYLYPTFTALLAWALLGERFGPRLIPAIALGWLGVLLMLRPSVVPEAPGVGASLTLAAGLPLGGVAFAVAGALLTALAYVSVRSLGSSEHPLVIVLYFPLVAIPLSLPLVLLDPVLPTPSELAWLLGVGVFTQLGQIGLTHGLAQLPAARATAISYSQVVFAGVWGWWLFGETPGPWTVLGALLILGATLLSLQPGRGP